MQPTSTCKWANLTFTRFSVDKYSYLVNGEASQSIQQFMSEEHSFQEFCDQVEKYRQVAAEIADLDSIVHFEMVGFYGLPSVK